jgi:hypothetical protein
MYKINPIAFIALLRDFAIIFSWLKYFPTSQKSINIATPTTKRFSEGRISIIDLEPDDQITFAASIDPNIAPKDMSIDAIAAKEILP